MELAELDELIFKASRAGTRVPQPKLIRDETTGELAAAPRIPPQGQVAKLKYSHHQVAQLLASGQNHTEISLVTGYHPVYIYELAKGQEFQELVVHYSGERKRIFDTTLERMKSLGIATLEKLQALLESEDEKWTKRELMEMAELMLVKPSLAKNGGIGQGNGGNSGVVVNVKFVSGQGEAASGPILDLEPNAA